MLDHLRQHDVAALRGALGVEHRVVITGALEHADQGGAFQHVELVGRLVEIGARRHFNAVGVVQERHGVEVGLEDLVLGVDRLDLQRGDGLLDLARDRGRTADLLGVHVAGQLLRDGGAALQVAGEGLEHGRGGALEVDAVVFVEAVVFGGNQRGQHAGRHVGQLDPVAVGALEHGQLLAVDGHHPGGFFLLGLAQVADAGREGDQQQRIQQQQRWNGGDGQGDAAPGGVAHAAQGFSGKGSGRGLKTGKETGEEFFHRVPV